MGRAGARWPKWCGTMRVLALSIALVLTGPAAALMASTESEHMAGQFRLLRGALVTKGEQTAGHQNRTLWIWPEGRRGYILHGSPSSGRFFRELLAYDLDSDAQVGALSFPLETPAVAGRSSQWFADGMPQNLAVDEQNGRIFVLFTYDATAPVDAKVSAAARGCIDNAPGTCTLGVHVVDARTMELQETHFFPTAQFDGGAQIEMVSRAIHYSHGKLLVLMEETAPILTSIQTEPRPRHMSRNTTYLLQIDPEGGTEWRVLVESCRGARENSLTQAPGSVWMTRPNPAAVFRSEDLDDSAIWVGCHVDHRQSAAMVRLPLGKDGQPVPLPISVGDGEPLTEDQPALTTPPSESAVPDPAGLIRPQAEVYVGPEQTAEIVADPLSQRMLLRVIQSKPDGEAWVVFDGRRRSFLGSIGIGPFSGTAGTSVLDTRHGRLYELHTGPTGGLFVADVRGEVVPQALAYPEFAALGSDKYPLSMDYKNGVPRVYVRNGGRPEYDVLEDHRPIATAPVALPDLRTLDLDERPEVTASTLDGAARGFGARTILIGGVDAITRTALVDPVGNVRGAYAGQYSGLEANSITAPLAPSLQRELPARIPCTDAEREIVLGFAGPDGPAVVDGSGSRGSATPLVLDGRSRQDLESPVSRCGGRDWEALWARALFGRAPVEEPGLPWIFGDKPAACLSSEADSEETIGQPVFTSYSARATCSPEEASGFGYVQGVSAEGLDVAQALSSYRVYRDPARGIVSRVESVARGISVDGLFRIDSVRGVAESWANGRRQLAEASDREQGYDANCDFERTAGTCFQRQVFGVWTPGWSCGPCGDEQALVDGVNGAFAGSLRVQLREPDPVLAAGAESGYTAAIQKSTAERFADLVLNNDLLQTILPTLEIVRYAPGYRAQSLTAGDEARGRQIYQFAGVEVSSSYSIQCLLVYDEATNTCAAAHEAPGSLALELTSPDGQPLAGGAFELRADSDEDGVVGLVDKLVPEGACVTADDGVGTCTWDALAPGKYVLTQIAAPPGYSVVKEPYAVELVSGEARTVTFTNVSNVSTINVSAADEQDKPLQGATFAVYADPDADGKVAPDAKPVAQCETGPDGACSMAVPVGSYVLVQLSAPGGLEPIEPVAFALTAGGETAAVTVVNYPQDFPAPPSAAGQVDYLPSAPPPLPQLHAVPLPVAGIPMDDEPDMAGPDIGGTIVRVMQAPGDVLRLLARDPVQAAAFAATLLLLTLAWAGVQRRRQLVLLTEDLSG